MSPPALCFALGTAPLEPSEPVRRRAKFCGQVTSPLHRQMRGEKPSKARDLQGYAGAMPQTEMGAGIAASPHLHRAKDLPVFASLTTRRPSAFRSLLTRSGVASNRGPARRQVLDLPRPFLGRVLPRRLPPGGAANCVRNTNSSGASSGGPTWAEALLIAIRWRSVLPSPAAPSCRCRLSGEAGTSVPITN